MMSHFLIQYNLLILLDNLKNPIGILPAYLSSVMSKSSLVKLQDRHFLRDDKMTAGHFKGLSLKKTNSSPKKIPIELNHQELNDTFNPIPQFEDFLLKILAGKNPLACQGSPSHDFKKGDTVYIPVHWKGKRVFAEGKVLAVLSDGRRKVVLDALPTKPIFLRPELLKHPEDPCVMKQRGMASLGGGKEIDQTPSDDEAELNPEISETEKRENEAFKGETPPKN